MSNGDLTPEERNRPKVRPFDYPILLIIPPPGERPITQRARPLGDTTDMTRAIVVALLLTVASTRATAATASGPTLADVWDGRAKWDPVAEKVAADFTFHCLSILRQDGPGAGPAPTTAP